MLKLLIILAAWIAPGIILFLYLLWVSKRRDGQRAPLELPLTEVAVAMPANNDTQQARTAHPIAAVQARGKSRLKQLG